MFVTSPKKENKQPWTVKASQGIQEPDSGPDISVVSSEAVPQNCYTGPRGEARGLVMSFEIARVPIEINGWNQTPSAGVIISVDKSPAATS
jgi:hypothetical protein